MTGMSATQFWHLISIEDTWHDIVVAANSFTHNVGHKGLVYITTQARWEKPIVIHGNTFDTNAGFFAESAIFVRVRTKSGLWQST